LRNYLKAVLFLLASMFAVPLAGDPYDDASLAAISRDPRNEGIQVRVSKYNDETILYDLKSVPKDKSPQDVFRVFLQFTSEVFKADLPSRDVRLAAFGRAKFIVPASHVSLLGEEYGVQNPMYTIRTFPQNLRTLENTPAYSEHKGGLLYLMRVQMNDFNDFLTKWFVKDLIAKREAEQGLVKPKEYVDDEAF